MTSILRFATRNDLSAVERIVRAAYAPYLARIGREPGPMLDDDAASIDEGRVHVAERRSLVQGVLVLVPGADAMLLDNIAVAPEAQGTGLGKATPRCGAVVSQIWDGSRPRCPAVDKPRAIRH